MAVPRRKINEELDFIKANREETYPYVLEYARRRFGKYGQIIIEDVVDSVYDDLKNGVRHLSSSKPVLESLSNIVRSKVRRRLKKERRHISPEDVSEEAFSSSPLAEYDFHLFCAWLREMFKDDPVIPDMIELWEKDQGMQPRDLAKELGIDVSKIYDAKDRIRRKRREIRERCLFK